MRAAIIVTLLLLLASQSYGQAGSNEIVIIKFDWTKERIDWAGDPLRSSTETYGEMRDRVRTERRRVSALEERSTRAMKEEQKKPEKPPRYIFRYVLTVHNTGLRTVSEIDWDFMFADAASGELLGKREFTSVEKIGPSKKKQLSILASAPPTQTISVYSLGSKEREGLAPSVIILRVQYDDGTVWAPANYACLNFLPAISKSRDQMKSNPGERSVNPTSAEFRESAERIGLLNKSNNEQDARSEQYGRSGILQAPSPTVFPSYEIESECDVDQCREKDVDMPRPH